MIGRGSGFIAANAALARAEVNFVLIPEVPFRLEGPSSLFRTDWGQAAQARSCGYPRLLEEPDKTK